MEPYEITMTDITGVKMLASNLHHRTDTETSLWNGNAVAAVSFGSDQRNPPRKTPTA